MTTRFVLHADELGRLDASDLLGRLGDDVAQDMRRLAPIDTGDMVSTVRRGKATRKRVRISIGGMRGASTGKPVGYAHYVENGTSKMSAQPFMRPALYRYRSSL